MSYPQFIAEGKVGLRPGVARRLSDVVARTAFKQMVNHWVWTSGAQTDCWEAGLRVGEDADARQDDVHQKSEELFGFNRVATPQTRKSLIPFEPCSVRRRNGGLCNTDPFLTASCNATKSLFIAM